jgi:hypothetical protein
MAQALKNPHLSRFFGAIKNSSFLAQKLEINPI